MMPVTSDLIHHEMGMNELTIQPIHKKGQNIDPNFLDSKVKLSHFEMYEMAGRPTESHFFAHR